MPLKSKCCGADVMEKREGVVIWPYCSACGKTYPDTISQPDYLPPTLEQIRNQPKLSIAPQPPMTPHKVGPAKTDTKVMPNLNPQPPVGDDPKEIDIIQALNYTQHCPPKDEYHYNKAVDVLRRLAKKHLEPETKPTPSSDSD